MRKEVIELIVRIILALAPQIYIIVNSKFDVVIALVITVILINSNANRYRKDK